MKLLAVVGEIDDGPRGGGHSDQRESRIREKVVDDFLDSDTGFFQTIHASLFVEGSHAGGVIDEYGKVP